MRGPADESVGEAFRMDLLVAARDKTLKVIEEVAALVRPGMLESEARAILARVQEGMGAPKSWHPLQIRFGQNTTLAFGQKPERELRLKDDDIFFLDIGPIFDGHEGDVGRSFAVGCMDQHQRCCEDAEAIWNEVRNRWKESGQTGAELYAFARGAAERRGWRLSLEKANGHRIADFPHAARMRGSIEEFHLHPQAGRWILEIQIADPGGRFGAFYEDLLF